MELELQQLDRRYEALRRRNPTQERRLLTSLATDGQQIPIVVVPAEEGRRAVIDGYKRVRALRELKQDVVLATEWSLPEADALVLEWRMRSGEPADALEQGWLLRELRERFELTEAELAARFERSQSWVSRRLSLLQALPEEIQERVRRGQLGAHAATKYLVPMARAIPAECLRLVAALGERKPTSRQVGELYLAMMAGGAEVRALLLKDPWLFLRAQQEARRGQEKDRTPAEQLLGDFGALGGLLRRLHARVRRGAWAELSADERAEVGRGYRTAQAEAVALFTRCAKEL